MHIILGILTTVVTILILLNRLAEAGIDIGGLNPFLWSRRRKWKKKYDGNPAFKIDNPKDATAILMVAAAKADGDITKEAKTYLLNAFEHEFNLSKKDAAGLLISSSYLLGDGAEIRGNIKKFLTPSKDNFSEHQISAAIELISSAAGEPGQRHPNAEELLSQVHSTLERPLQGEKTW